MWRLPCGWQTYLPPVTTNLTLALEVMDALGATAAFSR